MTQFTLVHFMLLIVAFSSINLVSRLRSLLRFVTLTCTPTNSSNDPAGKSRNLLAVDPSFFFSFFFFTKTTWPPNSESPPLPHPNQHTQRGREGGRPNSRMRGRALLSALHQETECERAARHHTEAPLKIHVYHSSSFIDGLSSLYVYEVRGLPVALVSDPQGLPGCPRNCLFPLI